jgi:hypothetical protein
MIRTIKIILALWLLFFTYLMAKLTIPYFTFETDVDFLLTKQAILHIDIWRWSFYIHIGTSVFVLLAGIFQFSRTIIRKYPKFHRLSGKMYVLLVLLLSAPSGLVMSFYANGGGYAKASFVIISTLWWVFTFIAYNRILKRNIASHTNFMIRSYALTLSAITLRLYTYFLPGIFLDVDIHLNGKEMYILVSWLSWIPNLLIAEILIRKNSFSLKKRTSRSAEPKSSYTLNQP